MSDEIVAYSLSQHPAPDRARVGLAALLYGLFAAPIFWAGNHIVDFTLVAHACYPGDFPNPAPVSGFGFVWPLVLALHLIALALIASGGLVAFRNWRLTGPPYLPAHHMIERGEGRNRYLGIVGMSFAVMFFILTAVSTISLAMVPTCTY
ncbi:MAG TPA: hypothetical protein VFA12_00700 [Stellaceae bacterium]|nr:hypothetical protein [Stellaceae bacterium]